MATASPAPDPVWSRSFGLSGSGAVVVGKSFALPLLTDGRAIGAICVCGSTGKPLPFVFLDELVVGQTLLVYCGALLMHLRPLSLVMRFPRGDLGTLFGRIGTLLAKLGLVSVLGRDLLATLAQLTVALKHARPFTHPRECEHEAEQNDHADDGNGDDGCGRHSKYLFLRRVCDMRVPA